MKCSCGLDDHLDQIKNYPVGTKVLFVDTTGYGDGIVVEHCDDGRACIDIGGQIHTFHYIDSFVAQVELPEPTAEQLQATITAQAAEIERLTAALNANRQLSVGVQLYDAELFQEQAAEIDRLTAALEQAESIRDGLVSDADSIGAIIFGDYVPDPNGNDRYSADGYVGEEGNEDSYDLPAYDGMTIEQARKVALLINEMMDTDWVDVTGERQ